MHVTEGCHKEFNPTGATGVKGYPEGSGNLPYSKDSFTYHLGDYAFN